ARPSPLPPGCALARWWSAAASVARELELPRPRGAAGRRGLDADRLVAGSRPRGSHGAGARLPESRDRRRLRGSARAALHPTILGRRRAGCDRGIRTGCRDAATRCQPGGRWAKRARPRVARSRPGVSARARPPALGIAITDTAAPAVRGQGAEAVSPGDAPLKPTDAGPYCSFRSTGPGAGPWFR